MIIGYKNNVPQRITIKRPCQGYYLRWYYNGWHYWFFSPGSLSLITEGEKYRTIGTKSVMMGTGQITYEQCQAIRTIANTREVYILTAAGWKNVRIEPGSLVVYGNQINGYEIELAVKIGSKEISITGFSPVADVPLIAPAVYVPPGGECIIGTQVWMKKNWDSDYPGSKVYNNDEANRAEYGGLYNYNQIISSGFCPTGWHVPTVAEWTTLIGSVGDNTDAGGKLKEAGTDHWDSDTTLPPLSCFVALGGGYGNSDGSFNALKLTGDFWTADLKSESEAYFYRMWDFQTLITPGWWPRNGYLSVRLIKDTSAPTTFEYWFLPSQDELDAMHTNLYLEGVGGFIEEGNYWSSTEYSNDNAIYQTFDAFGVSHPWLKSAAYRIRACRAFTSITNYNLRDIGPTGGLIFWKSGNDYLEAAPSDQSVAKAWSNITGAEIGVTAQGTAIGTGQANTTAIINQVGHTDSAAKLCDDLIT